MEIVDIQKINKELKRFKHLPQPGVEVSPYDTGIGVLENEEIRKVYSLSVLLRKRVVKKMKKLDKKDDASMIKIIRMARKSKILMEIFLYLVKDHFSLYNEDVEIRKGWVVVVPQDVFYINT